MHSNDTKTQFITLRAKGWSLARIAAQINVSPRTLVDWNQQSYAELRTLRALEVEALQEKVLASHESELTRLGQQLQRIEDEVAERKMKFVDTEDLFASPRSCVRRFARSAPILSSTPRARSTSRLHGFHPPPNRETWEPLSKPGRSRGDETQTEKKTESSQMPHS